MIVLYNFTIYGAAHILTKNRIHYDLTLNLDKKILFIPWMILIYWGCYLFWAISYVIIIGYSDASAKKFAISEILGKTICFIIYLLFPTTMQRADLAGNGIWIELVRWTYNVDAADNLFPSIHCYISCLCYLGVRKKKGIPGWFKILSLMIAVMIFISTLTVKQHLLVDVIAGILLAIIVFREPDQKMKKIK